MEGLKQLKQVLRKLEGLEAFLSKEIDKIVKKFSSEFVAANLEQLTRGDNAEGHILRRVKPRKGKLNSTNSYTEAYSKYKNKIGKQTAVVDLNLSGYFHKSIKFVQAEKNLFIFVANDDKADFLLVQYEGVLGILPDSLQTIADKMQPLLQAALDKYLTVARAA